MTVSEPLQGLSARCRSLIDGDRWDDYGSTYKVHAAILGGMHQAGWTVDRAVDLLVGGDYAGCQRLRMKFRGSLASVTMSRWKRVDARALVHEERCTDWFNEVITYWPFGGRYGATYRVLLALGVLAHQAGTTSFTASVRRIGEVAGVDSAANATAMASTKSVRASLKRLREWGLIDVTHHQPDDVSAAIFNANTRYTLASPSQVRSLFLGLSTDDPAKHPSGALRWISGVNDVRHRYLHPLFEAAGLGMVACQVWNALYVVRNSGTLSPNQLVEYLGIGRSAVYAALNALDEYRMVERFPDGMWRATERDLDDVADVLGVALRPQYRSEINRRDRANRQEAFRRHRRRGRLVAGDHNAVILELSNQLAQCA